jgi:hypothetical protein
MQGRSTPCRLEQSCNLDLANPWPAAPDTPALSRSHFFATIGVLGAGFSDKQKLKDLS